MKRLLFLLFLFIPFAVGGQVIRASAAYNKVQAAGGYCAEFQAVYDSWTNKPDDTRTGYYNTMVSDLVDAGYWARMDFFHFEANHSNTASEAKTDWISLGTFDLTDPESTAPPWTVDQGFAFNGSSDWLDINYNPSTDATHYGQDDATLAVYCRTSLAASTSHIIGAGTDSPDRWATFRPFYGTDIDPYIRVILNDDYAGRWEPATSLANEGLFIATRNGTAVEYYVNGTSLSSTTNASAGVVSADFYLGAFNYNGADANYINAEISCDFGMDGISDSEATEITTIIETCMDSLGTGVIP